MWKYLETAGLQPAESKVVVVALRHLLAFLIRPLVETLGVKAKIQLLPNKEVEAEGGKEEGKEASSQGKAAGGEAGAENEVVMVGLSPLTDLASLPAAVTPILERLGPYIADDIALYARLLRLFKAHLSSFPPSSSPSGPSFQTTFLGRSLAASLLPAVTLTTNNPGLIAEVWEVLRLIPYRDRYTLYNAWKSLLDTKVLGEGGGEGGREGGTCVETRSHSLAVFIQFSVTPSCLLPF